jgi:hypothetical protein
MATEKQIRNAVFKCLKAHKKLQDAMWEAQKIGALEEQKDYSKEFYRPLDLLHDMIKDYSKNPLSKAVFANIQQGLWK